MAGWFFIAWTGLVTWHYADEDMPLRRSRMRFISRNVIPVGILLEINIYDLPDSVRQW